jgi:hypothetical protein
VASWVKPGGMTGIVGFKSLVCGKQGGAEVESFEVVQIGGPLRPYKTRNGNMQEK